MSQEGESLQRMRNSAGCCSVLEMTGENADNNAPTTSSSNTVSHDTKANGSKANCEAPMIADAGSLSVPISSVSFLPERMLENKLGQEVATVTHTLRTVQGDSVNVHDINTLLNSKDARVMYISPDVFVFEHPGLSSDASENMSIILDPVTSSMTSISSSDTTLNSNYLVVVESIDNSQMLSTTMHRNLMLSPGNDISLPRISPHAHLSFSSTGNAEDGSKLRDVTDYSQPTITMVLDETSSHLGSKEILMEPNSFITYNDQAGGTTDHLTFHTVHSISGKTDSSTHSYESGEGSFIDISSLSVVATEMQPSSAIHHISTTDAALFNTQTTQTAVIQVDDSPSKHVFVQPVHEMSVTPTVSTMTDSHSALQVSCDKQNENYELEQDKKDRLKQELRFLEQCHLEHHSKQVKKHHFVKSTFENDVEECEGGSVMNQEEEFLSDADTGYSENLDVDDKTPIFSNVTATLNTQLLTHITGCQQYLLDKAQKNSSNGFDIEFASDKDCTFSGTLTSLVILHNVLKNFMKLKSRTLLEFSADKSKQSCIDKAVMCDLLKPYISLRGRQPKCSQKAAEMGFVNDIDLYLQTDAAVDVADREFREKAGAGERGLRYKRKRKRGIYGKRGRNRVKKMKLKQVPEISDVIKVEGNGCDMELCQQEFENPEVDGVVESDIAGENLGEQESVETAVASGEADLTDPLQQRLLEEQLKYKKIVSQRRRQLASLFEVADTEVAPELNTLSSSVEGGDDLPQNNSDAGSDAFEVSQENTSAPDVPATGRPKRGRPRKTYNNLCMREKVHARNPLTETAATKQQRNYEEQVSFKFFCNHCSFKTKRHSHFVSHMRCHKDGTEKKYTCKQCEFVTISIPMLKRHELKHSKSLFKCGICAAYTTDRQELLRRHFRMKHSIEQREILKGKLSCDRCRFTCLTSEEFEKHKSVHDRLNQVPMGDILNCPDCKKAFRSRMHLQRHIRDVHGPEVRPHLCDKCGKAFKRTDALQQHKLVHMSRTARSFPFKCTSCEKGFRSPAHLKEHMSMHSSERPFLCQYCGAAFKTQPVQKKHILTLHIRPRAHVCGVCCRQFNTRHALQRHENTHARPDSATEAAVSVIERENAMAEKEATIREKNAALVNEENQSASISVSDSASVAVEGQMSSCLVSDMINTSTVEEPLEQTGPTLQQAYIQGTQDGALYYFTGELPAL